MATRLRVCAEKDCPELSAGTRCERHTRSRDRKRGTRQQRGYDLAHTKLRDRWVPKVAAGKVNCWRCGQRITPLEPWDLGHLDDRSGYGGPEHVACNRATRARIS